MRDTRIVHGARCTWWDSIDKIGTIDRGGFKLPCCPNCASPLFEFDNLEQWYAGAKKYEQEHPGYMAFLTWARGRCFQTLTIAKEAYLKEEGKTFA